MVLGLIVNIAALVIFLGVIALIVWKSLKRSFNKNVGIFASRILASVLALILTPIISKALASALSDLISGAVLSVNMDGTARSIAVAVLSYTDIRNVIIASFISLVAFLVFFFIFYVIFRIVSSIVFKKIKEIWFKGSVVVNCVISGLSAVLFFCVISFPVSALCNYVGDAVDAFESVSESSAADESGVDKAIGIYNDSVAPVTEGFFVKSLGVVAGRPIANTLTTFKVNSEIGRVCMVEESLNMFTLAGGVYNLASGVFDDGDYKESVEELVATVCDSKMVLYISVSALNAMVDDEDIEVSLNVDAIDNMDHDELAHESEKLVEAIITVYQFINECKNIETLTDADLALLGRAIDLLDDCALLNNAGTAVASVVLRSDTVSDTLTDSTVNAILDGDAKMENKMQALQSSAVIADNLANNENKEETKANVATELKWMVEEMEQGSADTVKASMTDEQLIKLGVAENKTVVASKMYSNMVQVCAESEGEGMDYATESSLLTDLISATDASKENRPLFGDDGAIADVDAFVGEYMGSNVVKETVIRTSDGAVDPLEIGNGVSELDKSTLSGAVDNYAADNPDCDGEALDALCALFAIDR